MIEQVKALLKERQVTRAVIVDDAFDERPRAGDIDSALWGRFFDDLGDDDEGTLSTAFGKAEYDRLGVAELERNDGFVGLVWNSKSKVTVAATLFEEFERKQERKRADLAPLRQLMQDLSLACVEVGRDGGDDVAKADIIFLDLFLGYLEGEEAVKRAIERVKAVIAQRRETPPTVVLLSASPRLDELGPRVRDDAELLGCQFRMVPKTELFDTGRMMERLYDLAISYQDGLKLNSFLLAWEKALAAAKTKFVRNIRTLDLADYANMQALILDAEEVPVGDYVLDLYDLHLHSVLEGDEKLVRAAKGLNEIDWTAYPPAQFMPSKTATEMMDGALFHNQSQTSIEIEIDNDPKAARLGDVFLAPVQKPKVAPTEAGAVPQEDGKGPTPVKVEAAVTKKPKQTHSARNAYVVLSQACDLQHGEMDRVLLLQGVVEPYGVKQSDARTKGIRTPVMYVGSERFSVDWDVLAPETWPVDELPVRLKEGYRRIRRFRTPYALQLQQAFIGRLGRVGTLAALPARHTAGVRVYLRSRSDKAILLAKATSDADDVVCLIGRTQKGTPKEWLLLSERLQNEIRIALQKVDLADLPVGGAAKVSEVRDDPGFYRRLKAGLPISRAAPKGAKPFDGTPHDIVQIFTEQKIEEGEPVDKGFRPLVIAVDFA